jgi:hypothetical protein
MPITSYRSDALVQAFIHSLVRVKRPGELGLGDPPDISFDPADRWFVEIDKSRVGTEIVEAAAHGIGRPAVRDQGFCIPGEQRAVGKQQ